MERDTTSDRNLTVHDRDRMAQRCLAVTFSASVFLFTIKIVGGIIGNSQALIADAMHSSLDIVSAIVAYIGYRLSLRPPDKEHPYGHHNADTIAAFIVGFIILITGYVIVHAAIGSLTGGREPIVPGFLATFVAGVAIVTKAFLLRYANRVAKITKARAVIASREDHFAEIIATGGALVGIALAQLFWPPLDPIAALWVAAIILWSAVRIFHQNIHILMGGEPDESTRLEILNELMRADDVRGLHKVRIRMQGSKCIVKAEILVDPDLRVEEAHDISMRVARDLKTNHPDVADVILHIEPDSERRRREGTVPEAMEGSRT